MKKNIKILLASDIFDPDDRVLSDYFTVVELPDDAQGIDAVLREHGTEIKGIAVRRRKIDADMIQRLPALEIISSFSAGLERVDLAATAARGITVCNTSKALAEDVADMALFLLMAAARNLVNAHNFVRDGQWLDGKFPLGRSVGSLKVGIVGLGHIGLCLARRLDGIGSEIAYFGPRKKSESYSYFSDIHQIADWADALAICCPGGAATRHLIDQSVIQRLGPEGMVVNIARGSVIDEQALIAALKNGTLAGAGLDVFENEPKVSEELRSSDRVALMPHLGSATKETRKAMRDTMIKVLVEHFHAS